jgi:hypothetical protein
MCGADENARRALIGSCDPQGSGFAMGAIKGIRQSKSMTSEVMA